MFDEKEKNQSNKIKCLLPCRSKTRDLDQQGSEKGLLLY